MTINEIQDLIKFIAKAGVTEVEIEKKDFKITIKSEIPKKKGASAQAGETVIQVPMAAVPAAPRRSCRPCRSCARSRGRDFSFRRGSIHHR